MNLLTAYLTRPATQRILRKKPGQEGFSLIELVVVIAVLAVLTAIALPNFLGVSDDAAARSAQQSVITAFKECQVRKARGENTGDFDQADSADFWVTSVVATSTATNAPTPAVGGPAAAPTPAASDKDCFTAAGALNSFVAIPKTPLKFPKFLVKSTGDKTCVSGDGINYEKTATVGCSGPAGATGVLGATEGVWR
jgi:type IV pilus assembly protein PilA